MDSKLLRPSSTETHKSSVKKTLMLEEKRGGGGGGSPRGYQFAHQRLTSRLVAYYLVVGCIFSSQASFEVPRQCPKGS